MDLQALKQKIESVLQEITDTGAKLKLSAAAAANAEADYCEAKNKQIIAMKAEEIKQDFKRTVQEREAVYRNALSDLRRESMIREADYKSDRELFKGVLAKLNGLQTLVRIENDGERATTQFQT